VYHIQSDILIHCNHHQVIRPVTTTSYLI